MKNVFFLAIFATAIMAQLGCRKDPIDAPTTDNPPVQETTTANIIGQVVTESGTPLSNTTVTVGGKSVKTNTVGVFTLKNAALPVQSVVTCAPAGYFKTLQLLELKANKTTYTKLIMQPKTVLTTFNAAAGATVNVGSQGAKVALPASGYKDVAGNAYTGQVQVAARFVNTATPNFTAIAPGTMTAKNAQGSTVQLATYGMMEVLLTTPSGAALQLDGKKATITSPIAATQTNAPATIPLWYLDESTGIWKEEGAATKQGNTYIAEVAHFTWWNCDFQGPRATIKGRVVDCNGNPVTNIEIWGAMGHGTPDANGYFEGGVPAGQAMPVRFQESGTCGTPIYNHTENIPALVTGQVYDMGIINIGCPTSTSFKTITGHVEGCNGQVGIAAAVLVANNMVYPDINGDFSITLCTSQLGTNPTISATTLDDFYTTTVAIGSASTYNVGTMTICGNTSGIVQDNEFMIDGDGFSNQRVVFPNATARDSSNTGFSYLNTGTNLAYIQATVRNTVSTDNWTTNFPYLGLSYLQIQGKGYYPVSGTISTTSVTPTEIIGTYSGTVRNNQTNVTATITNGRFKANR